jgi:uncharacterized membrane protein YhaH (DUF805 family)
MNPNSMTPIDWAKRPIVEKYADFTGRAPRAEYWWFLLGIVVAYIVLSILENILGIGAMVFGFYGPLTVLLWLATIVPSIAVGVRRLHDSGRSGWWMLLPFVPYAIAIALAGPAMMAGGLGAGLGLAALFMFIGMVCAIVLLVFMCLGSTPGDNRYGPNPYGEGEGTTVPAE